MEFFVLFLDFTLCDLEVFFRATRHKDITLNMVKLNFHINGFSLSTSKHMSTKSSLKINNLLC